MRLNRLLIMAIIGSILMCSFSLYVYVGTYILPIAPYWVTQLPPNPPSPTIQHGEFEFRLEYEIKGEKKIINDVLICDFMGFKVNSIGGPKKREWKCYNENKQKNEIILIQTELSHYPRIVLETIGSYKIVIGVGNAEYFLDEPNYDDDFELPQIQVYNMTTGYYKLPKESEEFLEMNGFKIISWNCDSPIKNKFE